MLKALIQWYKARRARIEAERNRPPTEHETRLAQAQMQLALQRIRDYHKRDNKVPKYQRASVMKEAANALTYARKLDRTATVLDEERKDNLKLDLDMLAAELCYYEAFMYEVLASTLPVVPDNEIHRIKSIHRMHSMETKENVKKALKPAVRAVELQPHNVLYMQLLVKVYARNGHYRQAKELKKRALAIDPYNPETLALLGNR